MEYKNYEELALFISVDQLSKVLSVGRNSAYKLVRSGQVASIRVGKQIRIPKEAVAALGQKH